MSIKFKLKREKGKWTPTFLWPSSFDSPQILTLHTVTREREIEPPRRQESGGGAVAYHRREDPSRMRPRWLLLLLLCDPACESDPTLDTADQILAISDTLIAGEKRIHHYRYWYAIPQHPHVTADLGLIATHYLHLWSSSTLTGITSPLPKKLSNSSTTPDQSLTLPLHSVYRP